MAYEGNRYAGLNRKRPEDKAGWLGAAGTLAGAGLGLLAGPGGMAAGAKLGGALGNVGQSAVNGTLSPQGMAGDVMQGVSGFNGIGQAMDNKSILEAFMRDPSQFKVGFANGGLVTGPAMDMASQWAEMDPVQRAMLQAQQAAGPAPTAPTPTPLQQAQHPTLEALSGLLPQIMAAMPRPANPRNTKAIGAWAPALGVVAGAPATIAQGRRAAANAPIEQRNTAARSDYEAKRKAWEDRKTKFGDTALEAALRPAQGEGKLDRFSTPIPEPLRKQLRDLGVPLPDNVRTFGELDEIQQSMTRNATSSAAKSAAMGPKGPSPSDLISVGNQAETQYRLNPAVQKFETMSDALGKIAGSEPSGIGDLALIFQFMKILDPTSVVREGEFATAENSSGRFRQLWNAYNKFTKGDKLTPAARLEFLSHSKRYYKEAEIKYQRARTLYERRLQQYGIDPTMYLMDYTLPKETMGFVDNELNPPPAVPAHKPYEPDTKAQGVWRGR